MKSLTRLRNQRPPEIPGQFWRVTFWSDDR